MHERQFRIAKPLKMFIYLPLYMAAKKPDKPPVYKGCVVKDMPYARKEIGDIYIVGKRDSSEELLSDKNDLKVERIINSMVDGSYIVVLEKMVFEREDDLKEFLKNKRYIK